MVALSDILARPKRHKYGAVGAELDGHKFPSKAEMRKYAELKLLERGKEIANLEIHPAFPLVVKGTSCGSYVADFAYVDLRTGGKVVIDVKGVRTPVYKLKRKLFEALYAPLTITEVA